MADPKNRTLVEQIMSSSVMSLKEDSTVKLGKLSMEVAMIRHMPVIDSRGKLVGVVALADLLEAIARFGTEPVAVRSVMSKNVKTIHRKALAEDAARTLLENKIGCLPVLGDNDMLEGIVTETDFVRIAEGALRSRNLPSAPEQSL